MRFSAAVVALVSAAASVKASNFTVQVGFNDTLTFNPMNLTNVADGDQINFQFVSKNHSVVQSTFAAPCTAAGVSSGFQNVSDPTGSSFPTWSITVENATAPLWFFCSQVTATSTHCQNGMVFAVNPNANKTFSAFQAAALATNGTGPSNPAGSIISGTAGATDAAVSVSGSASEPAATAAGGGSSASGSASGSSTAPASSGSATSGAKQLMSGGSISVLALAGLVAGLVL